MADIKKLIPFIKKWEGGFSDDPADAGGATMAGITLTTYKSYCKSKDLKEPTVEDLKNISDKTWTEILKVMYWDKWKADQINSQSVANILVDWFWMSGNVGVKRVQKELAGVSVDGIVGLQTITALNSKLPLPMFMVIQKLRYDYIDEICRARPANEKYRRGWLNRLDDLKFND